MESADLPAEVTPIESSGGVFADVADGPLVYSKKQTGEFPDETGWGDRIRGR